MNFKAIGLNKEIIKAIRECGYDKPTEIQAKAIPVILEGNDILATAQTGTGKTAAFMLPIMQRIVDERTLGIQALVLAPTRELAQQIYDDFLAYNKYTKLKATVIFGGVSQNRQIKQLNRGMDIVVATPGRLIDLMNQRKIDLSSVETFVLDEADRLLDMGFVRDIETINQSLSNKNQTLMFSATMGKAVSKIARKILKDPVRIDIESKHITADNVSQYLYYVDPNNKKKLLVDLIKDDFAGSVLVFARTKRNTETIARYLKKQNIKAEALHGDKSQGARKKALKRFKEYETQVLVATDVASRGIDVEELSCVINYNIPDEAETYVHRVGRTGRADASGIAISFCDYGEKAFLNNIQKLIKREIPVIKDHPYPLKDKSIQSPHHNQRRQRKSKRKKGRHKKRNYKR